MAPKMWNANSPETDVVAIRSSRLIRLTSRALRSSTVSSSSLGDRPGSRIDLEILSGILVPQNAKLATTAHQVRQRVGEMSKFAKGSLRLAWIYLQTFRWGLVLRACADPMSMKDVAKTAIVRRAIRFGWQERRKAATLKARPSLGNLPCPLPLTPSKPLSD